MFGCVEAGQLIGEYDDTGAALLEHVWFNGAPVAVIDGSNKYYVHTDHLGTPRIIRDGNTVIWRWESDPFGTTAPQEDPDGDTTLFTYNLRFPGQYYDDETGLHYNYFRDYDASIGRYMQSDPIGLGGGLNTYAYAGGDPVSIIDPLGLYSVDGEIGLSIPFVGSIELGLFVTDGSGDLGCNMDLGIKISFSKVTKGFGRARAGAGIGVARGGRGAAVTVSSTGVVGAAGIGVSVDFPGSGDHVDQPQAITIEQGIIVAAGVEETVSLTASVGDAARAIAALVTGDRSQRIMGIDADNSSCGCLP